MKCTNQTTLIFVAILAVATAAESALAQELSVPRWQPHDFAFRCAEKPSNPFAVDFAADVLGPNGVKLTIPGFYDGDGTWKIRISPTAEGAWSLVTKCDVAELSGQRRALTCVANPAPEIHGALRVDRDHPRQFIWEDRTHYFPMGYECDWLWALDANDPALPSVNRFLDLLVNHGFNFVILNAYAHDTSWRRGRTGEDDFGPPPMFAWEGTNEQPDHARFNLEYWRHYDRVIEGMHRRGIVAHMFIKVYNKQVNWPANGSPEDDLYFRWLIARYAAYPNVHWDVAKEAQYEKDVRYKTGRLEFLRDHDPYRRLLTVHDDRAAYDAGAYDATVDYRSDQQHKTWRQSVLDHHRQRDWPVMNTEFGYEHGPKGLSDRTYNVVQSPEEVCRRAWEVSMAGGFVAYYYTHTAWDVLRPEDVPPGYAYFKYLREFFESTHFWRMKPDNSLVSVGDCLADAGCEYVVSLDKAKTFTLKLEGLETELPATWYQPLTGRSEPAGRLHNGVAELTPPAGWEGKPVALYVGLPRR